MNQNIKPDVVYELLLVNPVINKLGQIVYVILPKMIDKSKENKWDIRENADKLIKDG